MSSRIIEHKRKDEFPLVGISLRDLEKIECVANVLLTCC
jgi:hypothetical protein